MTSGPETLPINENCPQEKNGAAVDVGSLSAPDLKNWDYVYRLLVLHGADHEQLLEVIRDPRMPRGETITFALKPSESRKLYARLQTKKARNAAVDCFERYESFFHEAAARFSVSPGILAGIIQTESSCGKNYGKSMAFWRLARLVSAGDPNTIEANYVRKSASDPSVRREEVEKRAKWLEQTFLPHALAVLILASEKSIHPLELVGSDAGAIGMPQFLPANLLNFGIDGDKNGVIDLFTPHDAILSTANFLHVHGWKGSKMSDEEKRAVLSRYNRSTPYVDTILGMAREVERVAVKRTSRKSEIIANRFGRVAPSSSALRH